MVLEPVDIVAIVAYLLLSVGIALRFRGRAQGSLGEFFLSGRRLPWYVAGLSMVATTFAADTPLAVTELVAKNGIAGNWLWWNMCIGGMLTTIFFSRLWSRAKLFTDNELVEIRYGGQAARFLRGLKGVYLGLFVNALILGWVNLAMMTILQVFFGFSAREALLWTGALMVLTAVYSSLSGLWGVALTDMVQFFIAMAGCIILAIVLLNRPEIGGIDGLKAKLPASSLQFLPNLSWGSASSVGTGLSLGIGSFLAFIGVQWWASYYPGAEPGGGGYVAQRMMSARSEKDSFWATLSFQVMHYCLRPWPWILVGLCVVILFPDASKPTNLSIEEWWRFKYVMAMRDYLPAGLRGLLLVAFLAAYMSSVSTQLNWGTSYLVMDVYKRFVKKEETFTSPELANSHYILASKLLTFLVMITALIATSYMTSISGVWTFLLQSGAGLGLVLILRWYWWRINVWSEITATIAPFIIFGVLKVIASQYPEGATLPAYLEFPGSYFITVGGTTLIWLIVTFLTPATSQSILAGFYRRVQPGGFWGPVRKWTNLPKPKSNVPYQLAAWICGTLMVYALLFAIGKLIFKEYTLAISLFALAFACFLVLRWSLSKEVIPVEETSTLSA